MTIEVSIKHKGSGVELGLITIENLSDEADEFGDYSIRFAVDRINRLGFSIRGMHQFPRTKYNVLGLLLQALQTLEPWELELEEPPETSPERKALRWPFRKS